MGSYVEVEGLLVAEELFSFVRNEALPGTGVSETDFWSGARALIADFRPRILDLLARRTELQEHLDAYHRGLDGRMPASESYESFLREIGYLAEEPGPFSISTANVDAEISSTAGPQLVVPLLNARFAVNAANARWGSLYDALYGTDAIDEENGRERSGGYNPVRGAAVIARGRETLDLYFPLADGSHADVVAYAIGDGTLLAEGGSGPSTLADHTQFVGYQGSAAAPSVIVLVHHGLHLEIHVDRGHRVGAGDRAGVSDIVLESALTSIMDLEDSVAAVDVADKVVGYRNWLRLMQGTLTATVTKEGRTFVRSLNEDRQYLAADGAGTTTRPGRALMMIRQVGHSMFSDAVLDGSGEEIPEGILDVLVTGLGSVHDLRGPASGGNSRSGSVYVVKPKMHGPQEVALTCEIFARAEELLALPRGTIKIGIMDEERRTSVNLKACVYEARHRVAFINTGFLDRTGDEIHTSMLAGPMTRKAEMKSQPWIAAYEDANVDIGLECGFRGRAQIGKGMWAAPDSMADMLAQKLAHPRAGASCAWVPSPTAATLHALHYLAVDVGARQAELTGNRRSTLGALLTIPLGDHDDWDAEARQAEIDNNVQGILGYVSRWVNSGIGCSKVPDLAGTPLMEDRATCRISSQHLANWLQHGVVSEEQVEASLRRMAVVVDQQNADDPTYKPMARAYDTEAFLAARELALAGAMQPSGYTEPILHRHRRSEKVLLGKLDARVNA